MGKASRQKTGRKIKPLKKPRSLFPIIVTGVVVVLVGAVAAVAVLGNAADRAPAKSPASTAINQETGAIAIGNGPTIIDEYLDFGCPFCGVWFNTSSADVADVVERGLATLNIHPIAILDAQFQGTKFSTRAANAAYCVAEAQPDLAYAFFSRMFERQPTEATPGLTDDELISIASEIGAPEAASCITNQDYADFVAEVTAKTPVQPGAAGISTPTILVNGEFISASDDSRETIVAVAERG